MQKQLHESLLEGKAGVLIKTSLSDFPSKVAAVVFLEGCNLCCPYCYNTELVQNSLPESDGASIKEIILFLKKRKNVLSGLVVSGGEALLNPRTSFLISEAKKLGYKIKLDTNGTLPQKLREILLNPETKPDYIAMDLKAPQKKLPLLLRTGNSNTALVENTWNRIKESIRILSDLPKESREWRTVLVPGLVDESGIKEMAQLLPKDAQWFLAQFQNGNCLDGAFNSLEPYSGEEAQKILSLAQSIIPAAQLR